MPRATAPYVAFSQAIFDRICELIADGKSVRQACSGKGMPNRATFNEWRKRAPELQAQYDAACIEREEAYFEQIIEIADDCSRDTIATEKNGEQMNSEWVTRSRLRIDARKWTLARMNRKKYGDHVSAEHSGPDGGPIQTQVVRLRMTPVEELPE